ncbi:MULTISPECIES: histidine phosphatase family protein [unclassified Salinibacterium]|uniref:histidine phosphatase family protein n=1 Tax=unclassified Salinibacterium TaxID=2632331 RepID=UPI001421D0FD|nr:MULTISPECIES: histidine phosphatase family protein [unclassified Salinibacterium]
MRLLLIRHGQTPSNVLGALDTLVPGPGLTELGNQQAAAVPDALADENIGAIFASVQRRAQLTAAPLAAARRLGVVVREGLREISAGDLEMNTDWESVNIYHRVSFGWSDGELDLRMPGGENGVEVLGRFDQVVHEAVELGQETVAFVAHGQIIRTWTAARAENIDVEFAARHSLHNTGIVVVEGDPDAGWIAHTWNGVAIGGPTVDEPTSATGPGGEPS